MASVCISTTSGASPLTTTVISQYSVPAWPAHVKLAVPPFFCRFLIVCALGMTSAISPSFTTMVIGDMAKRTFSFVSLYISLPFSSTKMNTITGPDGAELMSMSAKSPSPWSTAEPAPTRQSARASTRTIDNVFFIVWPPE